MMIATRSGRRVLGLSLGLLAFGGIRAPTHAQALPERLLTPVDLERVGLKGTVRPSPEMYDPAEGLHFVRASDSALVLTVAALSEVKTGAELRATVELLSKQVTAVSVGDEGYLGLGGWMLVFRKGTKAFQLLTGGDVMNGGKAFLSSGQLTELAKVLAGRL